MHGAPAGISARVTWRRIWCQPRLIAHPYEGRDRRSRTAIEVKLRFPWVQDYWGAVCREPEGSGAVRASLDAWVDELEGTACRPAWALGAAGPPAGTGAGLEERVEAACYRTQIWSSSGP